MISTPSSAGWSKAVVEHVAFDALQTQIPDELGVFSSPDQGANFLSLVQ
jgi:hypothetical protein